MNIMSLPEPDFDARRLIARENAIANLVKGRLAKAAKAAAIQQQPAPPVGPVPKKRGRPVGAKSVPKPVVVPDPVPEPAYPEIPPSLKEYIKLKSRKYIEQCINEKLAQVALARP